MLRPGGQAGRRERAAGSGLGARGRQLVVAPQAEAVLARPGLPDVLHEVTARGHLQALGVQSEGLVHLGRTVRGRLILPPAPWRDLAGGRRGSRGDFLERKNMGLVKGLPARGQAHFHGGGSGSLMGEKRGEGERKGGEEKGHQSSSACSQALAHFS